LILCSVRKSMIPPRKTKNALCGVSFGLLAIPESGKGQKTLHKKRLLFNLCDSIGLPEPLMQS
jgi:hypothetical protein